MADLGAKGFAHPLRTRHNAAPVISPAIYRRSTDLDRKETEFDLSGRLSGTVNVAGVPQSRVRVGLMHRSNMNLIAQTHTNGAGFYEFKFLDITDLENYFIVFLDPRETTPWNYSLVRDRLSPG